MTLVQLRHAIALADSGSFTRAAATVFVTQPAFSRSVKALEDELGQPLFDRLGRRAELTAYGREALKRMRQLVFDADELAATSLQMGAGRAGAVRIGMGSGPGAMLMTPLLREMATRHATIQVTISRGDTALLVHALREHKLDALVVDLYSLPPASDLRVETMAEMRGAMMCRAGHPLTRWRGPLRFDALRQYPIASTPLGDEVARTMMERYGRMAHPSEFVTLRCEELSSLVEVVRRTDALLFAIRAAAPDLVELPLRPAMIAKAWFGLVTLAGRAEAPALPIVRRLMTDHLHD